MDFTPDQQPSPPRGGLILELVRPYRRRIITFGLISLSAALLEAFFLVLITAVALALVAGESGIGPVAGHTLELRPALAVGLGLLALRLALSAWSVRASADLTADVTASLRQRLSHAYLRASWEVQHDAPAGRLQSLLTTFVHHAADAVTTVTGALVALLSVVAFLGTGLFVDAAATGAVLIALAVVGTVIMPLRRSIHRRAQVLHQANLDFASAVSELGSLGMEMQTFGVRDEFIGRIDGLTHETTRVQRRVQTLTDLLAPIYITLAYTAVLGGVAALTFLELGRLEAVGAVMLLMLRSLSYGQVLATTAGSLQGQAPAIAHLREAIAQYRNAPAGTGTVMPEHVAPLVAERVSFSYTPEQPALSDLNLRIDPGELIGVIGPSGAGKSTLAQILLGLREPGTGSLEVAGVRLRDVDREWWSTRVAFVAQDANLITGTVAENIRFFRSGIGDEALQDSAARANVLEDIEALPGGFDAHLGERGTRLSGGQRQRLSIARALAGHPELLILDEPTSALDGRSERLIRNTLAALRGRVTVVIIAHRMSTLGICDRIVVIENGRITALGTPDQLSLSSDFYRTAVVSADIRGRA